MTKKYFVLPKTKDIIEGDIVKPFFASCENYKQALKMLQDLEEENNRQYYIIVNYS
jgi:hypothetical protein